MPNKFNMLTDAELNAYEETIKEAYYKNHCRVCNGKLEKAIYRGSDIFGYARQDRIDTKDMCYHLNRCSKCGLLYAK